jgi:hypothetical protein
MMLQELWRAGATLGGLLSRSIVYAAWLPFLEEARVAKPNPPVAVIMGSQSDWATMRHAVSSRGARIGYDARIIRPRTPDRLAAFAKAPDRKAFRSSRRGWRRRASAGQASRDERCRSSACPSDRKR